ncbi:SP-RING-type domain-containing protein [Caenorhabditis elegans]|nr:SP-RING-type domain-containing protein [Caenorhabditis elegans]CAA97440.1 SP-RING-type domain-containing protein [Caenorhabditis elegans]|eukprot:NP_001255513.1 MIZ-type zinc finger putative transcription factor [Caenorhabditis elegans]
MWPPQGVPMSTPGSSAGHMPLGAGAASFPGQMNGPPQHPGMQYSGQMQQLPYGQMEGNHAMYDQRIMGQRAAGRPGMMPDYPQMPMGQTPGNTMMRMPVQYPSGPSQMAGHPHMQQMQYGHMMRAPPVSVYGQMNNAQQYAVTAHPNPVPQPYYHPEVRQLYETTAGYIVDRELLAEGHVTPGSNGVEAMLTHDASDFLKVSPQTDVLFSIWPVTKSNDPNIQYEVYINQKSVMNSHMQVKSIFIKDFLISGMNSIHIVYNGPQQMYKYACEFVTRKSVIELRKILIQKRVIEGQQLATQQKQQYMQMANKRQAGFYPVSLNCVLSKKRMFTPAKHHECKKIFDLAQLINANKGMTRYFCQTCNAYFKFEDITADYFLLNFLQSIPAGVNDLIVEKTGVVRSGDVEDVKPKRGKKKTDNDANGNGIKRIKSEIIVKQETFTDMHGRNVPFSPMPMPGSVPPDWTRLQSPSFSMQSPNKVQLGPATPATPGMVFQNPASAGSMLNMSSPRQTMIPGMHPMMPPHDVTMRSGSAPYTPESVKNDKNDELLMHIEGLYVCDVPILENEQLTVRYMDGTKDLCFEDSMVYEFAESPKHQQQIDGPPQTLMAPGSTASSSGSTFTPPFDDIHLGNRPSH